MSCNITPVLLQKATYSTWGEKTSGIKLANSVALSIAYVEPPIT